MFDFMLYLTAAFSWLCFLRQLHLDLKASSWPTVEGTIVESRWEPSPAEYEDPPVVRYRYSVREKPYVGDNIYPGGTRVSSSGSYAPNLVARYAPGSTVLVRFNPDRPEDSSLEPHAPLLMHGLILAFALAVSVLAVCRYAGLLQY